MEMIDGAPLIIIGFNRADTMALVLARLSECQDLLGKNGRRIAFAFLDGARTEEEKVKVDGVANLVEDFKAKHFPQLNVIRREKNLGCRGNIVDAITRVLDQFGRAIIVEDDVLVSRTFLTYMDGALDFYEDDKRVWCVNANTARDMRVPRSYKYDVYLNPRNMCWGWGVWKDRWAGVDFDLIDWPEFANNVAFANKLNRIDCFLKGMLDSQYKGRLKTWDVQCTFHMVKNDLYAVEPCFALSKNIGSGTDSEHCRDANPDISTQSFFDFNPQLIRLEPDIQVLNRLAQSGFKFNCAIRLFRKFRRFLRSRMKVSFSPEAVSL